MTVVILFLTFMAFANFALNMAVISSLFEHRGLSAPRYTEILGPISLLLCALSLMFFILYGIHFLVEVTG